MFGLNSFFVALKNLTAEITRTASLFKAANEQLSARLAIDTSVDENLPVLPAPSENGNGHAQRLSRAKA